MVLGVVKFGLEKNLEDSLKSKNLLRESSQSSGSSSLGDQSFNNDNETGGDSKGDGSNRAQRRLKKKLDGIDN